MKYTAPSVNVNYAAPVDNAVQNLMRMVANTDVPLIPSEHQALREDDNGKLSEEELLLTPPFVYGFSLENKLWGKSSN